MYDGGPKLRPTSTTHSTACASHSCFAPPRFTGKERDAESGNDYFGARYYASSMGRMMSPDPSGLYYADPSNPQSLNLYSYVLNNPLAYTDPSGEECVWDDGSFDSATDKQTGSGKSCGKAGGTWIDPKAFSTLNAGDWSDKANSNIAGIAQSLNSTSTTITVTAQDPGVVGALPLEPVQQIQSNPIQQLAIGITKNTGNLSQGLNCATEAGLTGVASYFGVSSPTPNPAREVAASAGTVLTAAGKEGVGAMAANGVRVLGPTVAKAVGAFAEKNAAKVVPFALAIQGGLAAKDAINAYKACNGQQ